METCELCGRKAVLNAIVEGSIVTVCNECSKYGNVIEIPKPVIKEEKKIEKVEPEEEYFEIIVEDYPERVKKAREQKNLTQEKLASLIAEKESVIHKLEAGQMQPNLQLAKKLEQFLNIKLITEHLEKKQEKKLDFKDSSLTIGDILKLRE